MDERTIETRAAVRTVRLADLTEPLVADAEAAHTARQTGQPRGPITGLHSLDEALGAFLAPGLHMIQAAPGAGKTAYTLQLAAEGSFPALYVSAEMPLLEIFRRLIARTTETPLGRLKSGAMSAAAIREKADFTAAALPWLALIDGTLGFASTQVILTVAEALREQCGARSLLVIIDSLQVWARSAGGEATEYELVNEGLRAASGLAGQLQCPVVCVSHRNRPGQKEGGMHAGKGSGDLEYAAESLIELTPAKDKATLTEWRPVTLGIHKNRHGQAGVEIDLEFSGSLQSFREASATVGNGNGRTESDFGFGRGRR